MNLQLDDPIYRWLFSLDVLPAQIRKLKNGKIEIPLSTTTTLEIGHLFLKFLSALNSSKSLGAKIPPQTALKNFSTPQDRAFNWNVLSEVLQNMKYTLDPEMKRLIVSGVTQKLNELLKDLYAFFGEGEKKITSSHDVTAVINTSLSKSLITNESLLKNPGLANLKEAVDIGNIDPQKPMNQTENLLEFMIVGLSKSLGLKPNQTIVLFTRNTKYLAHVISKGVKGDFTPILAFLNLVLENMTTLIKHLENDETKHYLTTFLQTIKPALVSKSTDITRTALKLYQNLSLNLASRNLLYLAWEWLISTGLHATLLGLHRHPELTQEVVEFLCEIGQMNVLELFTTHLRTVTDEEHLFLVAAAEFLGPLVLTLGKEEIESNGILDKWIEVAQEGTENPSQHVKVAGLGLITELWLEFPNAFESDENKAMSTINAFKKACKDSKMTAFASIIHLFRMLETFSKLKDSFAPIVYKTLTFILIENCQVIEIRALIMTNLIQILTDLDSIPLSIVIEPWVKQIQVSSNNSSEFSNDYIWNIVDFEFIGFLANQEKLSIKNAIQILDLLSKIFLSDHVNAPLAMENMFLLINRFLTQDLMQEFLSKLIKISLAIYFAAEKKCKSKKKNPKPQVSKPNPSPDELNEAELNVIAAQKNGLIIRFLKSIAELKDERLIEKLKPLVAHTNLQLKKQLSTRANDKGMVEILSLWGNPDKISQKFETEYFENLAKEKLKKREEELKRTGFDTTNNISQISATSVREIVDTNLNNVMSASFEQKSPLGNTENPTTIMSPDKIETNTGELANAGNNFEKGLRSQGVGYKPIRSTLSKAEQIKLALLRNPKADPKILDQLKTLSQNNKDKNQSMVMESEQQKTFIEKQKVTLRKQLEKRAIEQGIAYKNLKDVETNLIFPLNSREAELLKEKKNGLFEIELLNMIQEEERDMRFTDAFFRTNQKVLKYLFVKYCNLSVRKTRPDTFEKITVVVQRMTTTELWKLLRDYSFNYLSQSQIESMVRLINVQIFREKDEKLKSLDYDGFLIFLVNLAYLTFSKDPPEDLRHLPPNFALERVLKHFREEEKNKGGSTVLYDDPESSIFTDSEVIKEFNRKLDEDPEYVLPDGYRKVADIKVRFDYKLADTLSEVLPESYLDCYGILNDLINEKLGFWLYEPISVVTPVYLARPKILNPVAPKVFNQIENKNNASMMSSTPDLRPPNSPVNKSFTVQPRKKVLEIAHKQPLSFNMKLEIAKFDPKYKYMAEEIGYLLEDVLSSVEKGLSSVPQYHRVVNKLVENRVREKSLEEESKQKKEQKRRIRQQMIKQQLKEKGVLAENPDQRKEFMKKRFDETKGESELETEQKKMKEKWEKRLKNHEDEKKKKEEEKKKAAEDEERKAQDEAKQKEQELLDKKKKFKEFNEKTKEKLKSQFDDIKTKRVETKKQQEKESETQKKKIKNYNEKVLPKILEKTQEQLKKDKEFDDLLKQKLASEEFQAYFTRQEPTFKALFTYLINSTPMALNQTVRDSIPLKTLLSFANEFELCPLLASFNEIISSYNTMTKGKPLIEGNHILNKIWDYMKISGSLNESEIAKINEGNERNEKEEKEDEAKGVSLNVEVAKVTPLTLNGLLFYFGLPIDPAKKEEVLSCLRRKQEKKEIKTNKKKKQELKKKLEGEGYENSPLLQMKKPKERLLKKASSKKSEENIEQGESQGNLAEGGNENAGEGDGEEEKAAE